MRDARALVLNAGSSSLKFALVDAGGRRLVSGGLERIALGAHAGAVRTVFERLQPHGGLPAVTAVGHRIVHGGPAFTAPCLVDARVLAALRDLVPLDPDHLPGALALLDAVRGLAPELPQVTCFDTAFHASLPRAARLLPLPARFEAQGLRRYGFHGLSYQSLLEELARVAGEDAARGRVVFAHLGSGSSLAAVQGGACVDTTMAFTPNSGVPMGTRSGDLDPGLVLHLLRHETRSVDDLDALLSKESGLAGLSGGCSDMRDLLAREATDPGAADAVAVYVHAVRKAVGALAAVMDGIDTLAFAAGIGENAPPIRARVAAGLSHLGVELDATANDAGAPVVSTPRSRVTVRVLHTDEERVLARETLRVTRGR